MSDGDYASKHQLILDKLNESGSLGYLSVRELSHAVAMDTRTVAGHLDVIQMDGTGVYIDDRKQYFATKVGSINLARKLGMELRSSRRRGKAKKPPRTSSTP